MEDTITRLDATVLEALRAAEAPVREAFLFERVRSRGQDVGPELFLSALERLAELGHVQVAFDHEIPAHDPEPFQPRHWRVLQ